MKRFFVVLLVVALTTVGPALDGAQKPVKVHEIHGDGGAPVPRTIEGLWNASMLVIDGTVEYSEPADETIRFDNPGTHSFDVRVRTRYYVRIAEVYKSPSHQTAANQLVPVVATGIGRRDRGSHIDEFLNRRLKSLDVGDRYVLFLKPLFGKPEYELTTERDDSVFRLDANQVQPRSDTTLGRIVAARGWLALQEQLRALRGR